MHMTSVGSMNFKTGGRGPGTVKLVGSRVCFNAPSLVSAKKKIHTVHIAR